MDKVVDHLLVFEGEGSIRDFPGNYTQYREWKSLADKPTDSDTAKKNSQKPQPQKTRDDSKRKLTYKEKTEMAQLEKDIEALEAEKQSIENELNGGTCDVDRITELSVRLPKLNDELDEKSMRWLELSELA